jgi:hypothetical protein
VNITNRIAPEQVLATLTKESIPPDPDTCRR